jgi:hypothetical protein
MSSLTKFGCLFFALGTLLAMASFALGVGLFPVLLFADSPSMQSAMEETYSVLYILSRVGPAFALLGAVLAIIGWWRRRRKGPAAESKGTI